MPSEQCSRCEKDLDTAGTPKWCKSCRAAYKREYNALLKEMSESRGFASGCTAMRVYLADNFSKYGTAGSFSGVEIAALIMSVRDPAHGQLPSQGPPDLSLG